MKFRIALSAFLAASCAAPSSVPTPPPGEGSKAPRPEPDGSEPVAANSRPKKDAPKKAIPKDETLGQCLARKGVHLYGASWCHPCHEQLAWFGDDAKNVPFTDCFPTDDTVIAAPECQAVGLDIMGPFPTWIFADGLKVVGTRSLKWLAISTDCPLRTK
ncbi:MAG TPA: hypothetical protein VL283_02860 [Candidatus Baltobacteraceae bacterium]|nr:hypothetical protein [Candidatus Baltobacteraceae bacterium]